MRELRNGLRVLNARVNGGSSLGISLGNMFSCGFGGRLNNDLKQFSTFSRNKDTTKPRISMAPASAQVNRYGSGQVAPPPRQQAQVVSQQPPMAQPQIQQIQIQVRPGSSPFVARRMSCFLTHARRVKSNQIKCNGIGVGRTKSESRDFVRQGPPPGMFGQPQTIMMGESWHPPGNS
jgi:hypothetical protein